MSNSEINRDKNLRKLRIIVEPLKHLIQPTEWAKKDLAHMKCDLKGLCEFGCSYCSSNSNLWHQMHSRSHARAVREQTGIEATPYSHPYLTYDFPDPVGQLKAELAGKRTGWGAGKTLAFGCLADNFSPSLVLDGTTRDCLELLLDRTALRIRVTTKNATVGNDAWIKFFTKHPGRFVVNLSIGTLDDEWARRIEIGTSKPTARVRAMRRLQDAGVPTGGMLCPIFPSAVSSLNELLDAIRPEKCEVVWVEPYNDRTNWDKVTGDAQTEADLRRMFGPNRDPDAWSNYAVGLYKQLRLRAENDGWLDKLAYMLYEASMTAHYARTFTDLRGVLLQSVGKDGRSKHPIFAELQERLALTRMDRIAYEEPEHAAWIDPEESEADRFNTFMSGRSVSGGG